MRVYYLKPEDLTNLNKLTVRLTGGSLGMVNEANLHFVCERAKQLKGNLHKTAAHYFYWLAYKAHAFTDGNKRTALDAMMVFLELNGYTLKTNNEELVGLALTTARGEMTLREVEAWIKARLKKR